ncbi:hypothetical protein FB45DRAFT_59983 [Roridomyces roridus]|uniref:Jacalin-type lectin domain-containing protein n=1 Tax=Roridomyces roridus TaxID=1738132 RepID=A0AAD7BQC5_9AGAR|nr:hypothetical protein FB45DRAFT_59983 [Roridomyces roridus]
MPSTDDITITQTPLVGGVNEAGRFSDKDAVISSGKVTIDPTDPIKEIIVLHSNLIDGIQITYNKTDGTVAPSPIHGTSAKATIPNRNTISFSKGDIITEISGLHGVPAENPQIGHRVLQLKFTIYNTGTKTTRVQGPFGNQNAPSATDFSFSTTGKFIGIAGFAVNVDISVAECTRKGIQGGLYGLSFFGTAADNQPGPGPTPPKDIADGHYHIVNRVGDSVLMAGITGYDYLYALNPPFNLAPFKEALYTWSVMKVKNDTEGRYEIYNKEPTTRYIEPQGFSWYPVIGSTENTVRVLPVPNEPDWYFIACSSEKNPFVLENAAKPGDVIYPASYPYCKISSMDDRNSSQFWRFDPVKEF